MVSGESVGGEHQACPLLGGEHDAPDAAAQAHQGGGVGHRAVVALLLGGQGLFTYGAQGITPVGHLEDVAAEAIEIAGVVVAAGTEAAADGPAEQQGQQAGDLSLGPVPFVFGCGAHQHLTALGHVSPKP